MRILFMDTYFPGLFRFLAPYAVEKLGHDEKNEIIFLSEYKRRDYSLPNVRHISIRYPKISNIYPAVEQSTLSAVRQINAFAHAMQELKDSGFYPDIIVATEPCSAEIQSIFPNSCNIVYFDLYYNNFVDDILISHGKLPDQQKKSQHLRNAFQLSSMMACHNAIVPSLLQKESFPSIFHDKISVLPMGVDATFLNAEPNVMLEQIRPELVPLLDCSELITWSSRNPNEYAAFSTVCQAIPQILEARPQSQVVLVTHNVQLAMENPDCAVLLEIAQGRVHLFGKFTWNEHCMLLSKSAAHIYMSAKPHLPTSLIEAMCCGALVVASDTRSVREIVERDVNGFLVDFFSHSSIADAVIRVLELNPEEKTQMRKAAQDIAVKNYAAQSLIPQHYEQMLHYYITMEAYPQNNKKQL